MEAESKIAWHTYTTKCTTKNAKTQQVDAIVDVNKTPVFYRATVRLYALTEIVYAKRDQFGKRNIRKARREYSHPKKRTAPSEKSWDRENTEFTSLLGRQEMHKPHLQHRPMNLIASKQWDFPGAFRGITIGENLHPKYISKRSICWLWWRLES